MPKVLILLRVGDKVESTATKTEVTIVSEDGKRLGKLQPEWGKEIAQAIALGSSFSGIIKSVKIGKDPKDSTLSVFLRETKHSKKLAHPIFPVDKNFTPYVRDETLSHLNETGQTPVESPEETDRKSVV